MSNNHLSLHRCLFNKYLKRSGQLAVLCNSSFFRNRLIHQEMLNRDKCILIPQMPAIIILYLLFTTLCAFLDNQKALVSVSVRMFADVLLFIAVAAMLSHTGGSSCTPFAKACISAFALLCYHASMTSKKQKQIK